jgi:hypothetical protein
LRHIFPSITVGGEHEASHIYLNRARYCLRTLSLLTGLIWLLVPNYKILLVALLLLACWCLLRPSGSRQPLVILIVLADPTDQPRLRLLEEKRILEQALQPTGLFELRDVPSCRSQDLMPALLRHKPTVLQFSGHGSRQGLCFEDDTGRSRCVNYLDLARLFRIASSECGLKAVILNSCFSNTQAQVIADAVGFVIAMKETISDPSALAFTRAFYTALGERQSVEKAFEWAAADVFLQTNFNSFQPNLVLAQ